MKKGLFGQCFPIVLFAGAFTGAGALAFQAGLPHSALIVLNPASLIATQAPQGAAPIPSGWKLKVNAGRADITTGDSAESAAGQSGNAAALHFRSSKASYALERDIDIDPAQLPLLSWRWKVTQLPQGGDFRHTATDDQAAQVFVAFDSRHILSYIWDTTAPAGSSGNDSIVPFVHIFAIVCRSSSTELNRWVEESHDVAADYRRAFGQPAPHVKGLRIQINSQHTGTSAESYFGEMQFHPAKS